MKNFIYMIRDVVADECGPPFQQKNDSAALRAFGQFIASKDAPEDFELLCCAEVDTETGEIQGLIPYRCQVTLNTEVNE